MRRAAAQGADLNLNRPAGNGAGNLAGGSFEGTGKVLSALAREFFGGDKAMLRGMAQHRIVPVVDKVFAFEELKEAMAYLKSGAQFGKVCIQH